MRVFVIIISLRFIVIMKLSNIPELLRKIKLSTKSTVLVSNKLKDYTNQILQKRIYHLQFSTFGHHITTCVQCTPTFKCVSCIILLIFIQSRCKFAYVIQACRIHANISR